MRTGAQSLVRGALKPCSDVDAVPENVIALDQDVTEVNPDPKQHTPVLRDALVALGHHSLHSDSTLDRIDHRGKLKNTPSPVVFTRRPPCFCHEGVGNLAVVAECAGGADLVEPHEPGVTGNISGHYCCQPASDPNWLLLHHGPQSNLPHILYDGSHNGQRVLIRCRS